MADPDSPPQEPPPVVRRPRRVPEAASPRRPPLLAVVGAIVGIGLAAGGVVTEERVEPTVGTPPAVVVDTPLFSARRAPEFIAAPVAVRRLQEAMEPVLDQLPRTTCTRVADGRAELQAREASAPLVPASNLKLLTASAVLDRFGTDTTLTTTFASSGMVDGVVADLHVIGGGDPLLATDTFVTDPRLGPQPVTDLEEVADRLVAAGLRRITGSVVGDDSRYDSIRRIPTWPDRYLAQGQVGGLSALTVNDGRGYPAIAGGPVPGVDVGPQLTDPAGYAAGVVTELLAARGVDVAGAPRSGRAPEGLTPLLAVPSLPMGELVAQMVAFSDNVSAELLLKELGRSDELPGSTEAGVAAVAAHLERIGAPLDGFVQVDGSGLDPANRVSCALLDHVLATNGPDGALARALAVPGEPGTLRQRYVASPAADQVRAKTGTLRMASGLSGWVVTDAGVPLRFAVMMNPEGREAGDTDRRLQERFTETLLGYPDRPPIESVEPLPPRDRPGG